MNSRRVFVGAWIVMACMDCMLQERGRRAEGDRYGNSIRGICASHSCPVARAGSRGNKIKTTKIRIFQELI